VFEQETRLDFSCQHFQLSGEGANFRCAMAIHSASGRSAAG
jgi:hypothetical protein